MILLFLLVVHGCETSSGTGKVYVADYNHAQPTVLSFTPVMPLDGKPYGIAGNSDGDIFVTEPNKITKIAADGSDSIFADFSGKCKLNDCMDMHVLWNAYRYILH